jgi:type VI secretion system protein ImpI
MIPLVVHVVDLEGGREEQFAFLRSPVRIGRGDLNDLPLAKPFVSTYHGLVQFDDDGARYVDLGSMNGSVLDGVALQSNALTALEPGAELVLGTYRLTFERRVTGEQGVAPRPTMFAVRAATMAGAGSPAPPPEPAGAEAPRPPAGAGPPEGAAAEADAVLGAASLDLDLDYASYRGAWDHLRSRVEQLLAALGPAAQGAAVERLAAKYEALRREPQFLVLAGDGAGGPEARGPRPVEAGPPGSEGGEAGLGLAALRLLRAFGESYLPGGPPLASPGEVESVLGRVAGVLETFGRSFLELRRGYEEFGRQMGVRTVQAEGSLLRASDPSQVLAYLLEPGAEGRDAELQRAFADFMIHQVALLRGVVDGARALLGQLSPEAVSSSAPPSVWPMRAASLWKEFEQRFHDLADEESSIAEVLFGREFARAYAAMAGHQVQGHEGADPGTRERRGAR